MRWEMPVSVLHLTNRGLLHPDHLQHLNRWSRLAKVENCSENWNYTPQKNKTIIIFYWLNKCGSFPAFVPATSVNGSLGLSTQPALLSLAYQFLHPLYKSLEGTITTGNGKENVGIEKKNEVQSHSFFLSVEVQEAWEGTVFPPIKAKTIYHSHKLHH